LNAPAVEPQAANRAASGLQGRGAALFAITILIFVALGAGLFVGRWLAR
jgi:hypothetical protein